MPFTFSKPIKVDGQGDFPFAGLTLVVSPAFREKEVEAHIVLSAKPYDVRDGKIVRPMEPAQTEHDDGTIEDILVPSMAYDKSIVFGSGYADSAKNEKLAEAFAKVAAALQEYVMSEPKFLGSE